MVTIVECGGFQFKVAPGDIIKVPLVDAEKDAEVTLDRVLLTSEGGNTVVGTPVVQGILVKAKVLEHAKAPKVVIMKKKRRKGYMRKTGHRQPYTRLQIVSIG